MRLPNQWSLALLKRVNQPIIRPILVALSLPLIFLAGCSGGTPSMARVTDFFSGSLSPAESPTPTATPTPTTVPTPVATPQAEKTTGHPRKKTARQAPTASKQAASVPNHAESPGPSADVSLEANPGAGPAGTPALSSPALESSGSSADANPAKAVKLIQDVDRIEKRVDRKNLSADDSQRDILAQKLLQEAKKSLAERDSVAAISLATKASTLLESLPKLADSASPTAP